VLVVVVAVVLVPIAVVWCSGVLEGSEVARLRERLEVVAERASDTAPAQLDGLASQQGVRLRVVDTSGLVMVDHDYAEDPRWLDELRDPFVWGPAGRPPLDELDRSLGPLTARPEVLSAAEEPSSACVVASAERVLLCGAAVRRDDGRVLHVSVGSTRALRSLYEDRFQLASLSSVVLSAGMVLALWVGWRMVRPIESLRDQVVARAGGDASTRPVVLDRSDELGDLARAFNELLGSLERRNQSNAAFAADLAHELKNPVAAVRAAAEALDSERPVEGQRKERLQRVLADASARMTTVVDRFLELARAEAGLPDEAREPVDLVQLVAALTASLRADARFEGVHFVEVVQGPVEVRAAPERVETAVRNLLHNAAVFAADGGTVRVEVAVDRDHAVLTVLDSGPGIAEADLPRVFDRYFTTRDGGTGLGLALTRAIVEAHGGRIVASSPGGARFEVRLPVGSSLVD
jgi:signal transduction histidine kinase